MTLFERVSALLGLSQSVAPAAREMREGLEAGRRAKFAENYPLALEHFDTTLRLAEASGELAAVAVIALHKGEVLIRQQRWEEAETLLMSVLEQARAAQQGAQAAYTLCVLGTLAQERGDWAAARAHYEESRQLATAARSGGAEGRALAHLADTYLHDGNASYAAHLLRDALPKLNTAGDIELSSYYVGLLGQALIASGQEIEGQHLLTRALQLADNIQYRIYQRHWSLALADYAFRESRFADADNYYQRALALFPDGDTSPVFVTALAQASQVALGLRNVQDALDRAGQAATLSLELDEPVRALAQASLGMALRAAGRGDEAIAYLQRAAESYGRLDGAVSVGVYIEVLRNLAAAQSVAAPDAAVATYQRAIELAEQRDVPLELAQTRRDLGLLYSRRGERALAVQEWLGALGIYDEHRHYAQVARLYSDIANARRLLGQGQRAMKDHEQALMMLNNLGDSDLETRGLVLSGAANAYVEQGDIDSADAFFTEAITIAEKLGDRAGEATRRGNYGWFLLTVGRPRRAIATLEQALATSRSLGLTLPMAVQMDNLGLCYDSLGDYPTALKLHEQALELLRALPNPRWTAIVVINRAHTLMSLGRTDEVGAELEEALAFGRTLDDAEILVRGAAALSRAAVLGGRPETVDALLEEGVQRARRSDYRRLLAEVLNARSEQQAALGNHQAAAAAWEEAQKLYHILRMPQAKQQPLWLSSEV